METDLRPIEPMWAASRIAAYMGVDVQTVYRWMWSGIIKSVKIGNARRVPQSEVQRLVNQRRSQIETEALEDTSQGATQQ